MQQIKPQGKQNIPQNHPRGVYFCSKVPLLHSGQSPTFSIDILGISMELGDDDCSELFIIEKFSNKLSGFKKSANLV